MSDDKGDPEVEALVQQIANDRSLGLSSQLVAPLHVALRRAIQAGIELGERGGPDDRLRVMASTLARVRDEKLALEDSVAELRTQATAARATEDEIRANAAREENEACERLVRGASEPPQSRATARVLDDRADAIRARRKP